MASPIFLHTSSLALTGAFRRKREEWIVRGMKIAVLVDSIQNPVDGLIATHPRNRIKCCGQMYQSCVRPTLNEPGSGTPAAWGGRLLVRDYIGVPPSHDPLNNNIMSGL